MDSLSPRLISNGLIEEERLAFERRYRREMQLAAESLDLTAVWDLLCAWRRIVELTEREGVEQRRRVLQRAAAIWRNRDHVDRRREHDVADVLAKLMTADQRRQAEENRARLRREFDAGKPLTDSAGNPIGRSEPYCLVPLDELTFEERDPKG